MKKILLLLLCVLSFNAIHADVTWDLSDDGALTISGTGAMENYILNGTNAPWYPQRNKIKNVVIENGVTNIGSYAFYECTYITSVTIPNSVTTIEYHAFERCLNLTSITIPNSVTSIGSCAFRDCFGLTSITIPNSVTSIGSDAFDGTKWYNNLPDGLLYIGQILYKYKGTMPTSTKIVIKEGTKGIGYYAFYGCSGLTSITIPNSVTSISAEAFNYCSGLTSIIIPNSVTSIGRQAFSGCI